MIATDGQKVIRRWYYKGSIKSEEVSPLLMSEFGSGWLAEVLYDIQGVGQGTFPHQKHAFDEEGWNWTTPDGVTHHSMGEPPQPTMFSAIVEMQNSIEEVAREVFGG